ncbi:MAG: ubiquitin-like small modifier protein 1 [Myxococcota bacterium]
MHVNFFATFRTIVGGRSLDVPLAEGASVGDLVAWLSERYPEIGEKLRTPEGAVSRQAHIFVDGRGVQWLRDGLETPLEPNQKIDVFPAVAGG